MTTNAAVSDFFQQVKGEAPTLVLTYEHLVADASAATRGVCEAFGISWDHAMTNPYETDATRSFEPASRVAATDPKLLRRRALEPRHADRWREVLLPQPLGVAAKATALSHGYELLPELPDGLQWLSRNHAASGAPPIACIHDFTGGLWAFHMLAPLLHAPCLGIYATRRGLSGCNTHHQIAQRYLQLLPGSLWPDDTPVRILAYSLGCRIAHRMACELQRVGRAVKLILLDGPIGASGGGHAARLAQIAAAPPDSSNSDLPDALRRALEVAGEDAREVATSLMALTDSDPDGLPAVAGYGDTTQALYVAAASGQNRHNGTAQHALRIRPRAVLHEVDGTHFDFLMQSAHEVAQISNEFLLGATALLG